MNAFLKTKPKETFLAQVGIAGFLGTMFLAYAPLPTFNHASRSALDSVTLARDFRVTGRPADMFHPTDERRVTFTQEEWSFEVQRQLSAGQDGRLVVKRTITTVNTSLDDARTRFLEGFPSDSNASDKPVIRAEGDFRWQSTQSQPLSPNATEWSWLFTAKQLGDKEIQIALPTANNRIIRWQKTSTGPQTKLDSRFIHIPVKVTGPLGLSENALSVLKALGTGFGALFTAPLIVAYITWKFGIGKEQKEEPRTIKTLLKDKKRERDKD